MRRTSLSLVDNAKAASVLHESSSWKKSNYSCILFGGNENLLGYCSRVCYSQKTVVNLCKPRINNAQNVLFVIYGDSPSSRSWLSQTSFFNSNWTWFSLTLFRPSIPSISQVWKVICLWLKSEAYRASCSSSTWPTCHYVQLFETNFMQRHKRQQTKHNSAARAQ